MPGETTVTSSGQPPAGPSVPYQEVTDDAYAPAYVRGARILSSDPEATVLGGTCPRCGCPCVFEHVPRTFRSPRRGPRVREIPMMCTCTTGHEDRPAGEEGCGAYWNVRLEDL